MKSDPSPRNPHQNPDVCATSYQSIPWNLPILVFPGGHQAPAVWSDSCQAAAKEPRIQDFMGF